MEQHQGERVIVRAWGGAYLVRRVWAAYPWAVEVMGDAEFDARQRGEGGVMPIPFPREDVFVADPEAVQALAEGRGIGTAKLTALP
jgi:hypothetical protein